MAEQYAIVLTTVGSGDDARRVAEHLVGRRLAACVQSLPIDSVYTWKDEVCREQEVLLLVKTRAALYEAVEAAIREVHAYDTPEIVRVPIDAGFSGYLAWIDEVTEPR